MLKEAERVNKRRIDEYVERVHSALWIVKEKKIGVLGLAFKANTDDIRFSPAIEVIGRLRSEGARICASDPQAIERTRSLFPDLTYSADPYEAAKGAEALLILTEWPEYRTLDWKRIRDVMMRPLVLDGRNLLEPAKMSELGFEYYSFGRPSTLISAVV
jgi:UDPglucose 6-dehydrogenase